MSRRCAISCVDVRTDSEASESELRVSSCLLSWATGRHPERVPVNYLHGIPRFYEGADRAEIIWEDAEIDLFCRQAPERHADAVRLARETGLRIGDLVELERREIKRAPDGSRAIILRPNKRRKRIVNMPLTAAAEAVADPVRLGTLRYLPATGAFAARFVIAGIDQPVDVTGRIDLMVEAPQLVAGKRAGEMIGPADIEMKPVPLRSAEAGGDAEPAQLVGKALVRQTRAGVPLRPSDVAEPDLVARNAPVTIVFRNGPLTLTVKGQALGGASRGQPVQVLNLMSRKVLTAVVTGAGTVEVSPAATSVAGL